MSSDTNNSANNIRPGGGKANKRELIKDLAAELEKWKIKSQLLGDQIDDVEQKLEKKYVEKDKAEQHYQSGVDQNDRVISALRREIAVANAELEAAAMLDEREAERYLNLLEESSGTPLPKATPSLEEMHRHCNGPTAATSESLVDPPFAKASSPTAATSSPSPDLAPKSSQRALRGMSDLPFGGFDPPSSSSAKPAGAEARVAQRLARVESQLNGASPPPVVPLKPTPLSEAFQPLPLLDLGNTLGLQGTLGNRTKGGAGEIDATERRRQENAEDELNRVRGDARPASFSLLQKVSSKVFPSLGAGGNRKASWAL